MNDVLRKKLAEDVLVAMYRREPHLPGEIYGIGWFCRDLRTDATADDITYVKNLLVFWKCGKILEARSPGQEDEYIFTMYAEGLRRAEAIIDGKKLTTRLASERTQRLLNIGAFVVSLISLVVAIIALTSARS